MTSVAEYFHTIAARLTSTLGKGEGEAAARIIFEDVAGYDRKYLFMNGDREITDFMQEKIDGAVKKVEGGEPVQYAVGKAKFMGNDYAVTPDVLIPRPETAGLVDLITSVYGDRSDLSVLDIGTGSGCIAISLARALPFARVNAIDVSTGALEVAKANAKSLGAKVDFEKTDILSAPLPKHASYDIVVSNPPYICRSETKEMDSRVLDHEPDGALFVPDDDPLFFYRAIATYARAALVPGGSLWFAINSRFPDQMRTLLEDLGFEKVDVTRDYRGLYRYASAIQPS